MDKITVASQWENVDYRPLDNTDNILSKGLWTGADKFQFWWAGIGQWQKVKHENYELGFKSDLMGLRHHSPVDPCTYTKDERHVVVSESPPLTATHIEKLDCVTYICINYMFLLPLFCVPYANNTFRFRPKMIRSKFYIKCTARKHV